MKTKRHVTKFFIRADFDNQSDSFQNEIKDGMLSFLSFASDILTKVCFPNLIIWYK